ncbi:glycosyltransferase [Ruegeria sp. 2012CJ41-6]|uniref:Glycosyltransferase n=1 Tax=Ruegeria spongiae TaxID=2942209 RepID=A0ABT0Q735_9RHOB|nr:glycosyltransferase [Ruegeria spongiae]MCL6285630.1 glycosyltransferase [Ruegeria spongiae]
MTDPSAPQVTVVIAAWNAVATLERAVQSALQQTVPVEVVVVDDASTDDTVAVAERLAAADPRLHLLHQPENCGPSAARNRAIAESTAPWIAVLDSDDFIDPDRLERLLAIATETGAAFVADDLLKVDEADPYGPRDRMWSQTDIGRIEVDAAMFVEANLSVRYGGRREMGFLKPLMSRAFLEAHGLSYEPQIRLGEDYVLYAAALVAGARFILTDPAGYVAVVRPNSLSGSHPTCAHEHLIVADRALLATPGLAPRAKAALQAHLLEQQKKWAWRRLIDAKRARDPLAAAAAFRAPLPVMADLAGRLWHDLRARLAGDRPGAQEFDVLVVADGRFSGGSTAALVADVTALAGLGLQIGLLFVRSAYLDDERDPMNPNALALCDLEGVTQLAPDQTARAPLAFLHHPLVFFRGIEERARLSADRAVIVTHHAPFRNDGSLEYDPVTTARRARRALGLAHTPWFAPISGVVRRQLASFAPLLRMSSEDWPNIFDPADWPDKSPILQGPRITIGRHGRADALKFPATGPEIDASLPAGPDITVRILGCPTEALVEKGAHPDTWEVLPFGAEPVAAFLNSLDVFVYHYHSKLTEAFGRTVLEAILCGRACLVDPRLEPTFGDMVDYCDPVDTRDALARIAANPDATRVRVARARDQAIEIYGRPSLGPRWERLTADPGVSGRAMAAVPPTTALRKLVGLYRRRVGGATG